MPSAHGPATDTRNLTIALVLLVSLSGIAATSCSTIVTEQLSSKPSATTIHHEDIKDAASDAPPVCNECALTSCCDGVCVDTSRDPLNCGECGHRCTAGRTCSHGACSGGWKNTTVPQQISNRIAPCVTWTGSRFVVWGGFKPQDTEKIPLNTGATYDPFTDKWFPMNKKGAPSGRYAPSCISISGNRVFVWGGKNPKGKLLRSGGIYDIDRGTWVSLNALDTPAPEPFTQLFWTGSQVLLWTPNSPVPPHLVRYDPDESTWTRNVNGQEPPVFPDSCAAWDSANKNLWIVGGRNFDNHLVGYDSSNNRWFERDMSDKKEKVKGRNSFCAIVGKQLLVWGGKSDDDKLVSNLATIDLESEKITMTEVDTSVASARNLPPDAGAGLAAGWLDSLLIFGGVDENQVLQADGFLLRSGAKQPNTPIPPWPNHDSISPTSDDRSVWTGEELFVWHGHPGNAIRWKP